MPPSSNAVKRIKCDEGVKLFLRSFRKHVRRVVDRHSHKTYRRPEYAKLLQTCKEVLSEKFPYKAPTSAKENKEFVKSAWRIAILAYPSWGTKRSKCPPMHDSLKGEMAVYRTVFINNNETSFSQFLENRFIKDVCWGFIIKEMSSSGFATVE